MFEEWYGFYKDFTNSLTLPSDLYSVGDAHLPGVYNIARSIKRNDNMFEAVDTDSDDSIPLPYTHDLDSNSDSRV